MIVLKVGQKLRYKGNTSNGIITNGVEYEVERFANIAAGAIQPARLEIKFVGIAQPFGMYEQHFNLFFDIVQPATPLTANGITIGNPFGSITPNKVKISYHDGYTITGNHIPYTTRKTDEKPKRKEDFPGHPNFYKIREYDAGSSVYLLVEQRPRDDWRSSGERRWVRKFDITETNVAHAFYGADMKFSPEEK